VQPLNFLEAPLAFLSLNALFAEESMAGRSGGQHAKHSAACPIGMFFLERHPDADAAFRVDFKLTVLLDIPELFGRCVVKNEDNWRQPFWQIDFPVQNLRNRHRPVAARVDVFKVLSEMITLAGVQGIVIGYQVVLGHRYPAELVRHAGLIGGGKSRWGPRGIAGSSWCIRNGGLSGSPWWRRIGSSFCVAFAGAGEYRRASERDGRDAGKH